MLQVTKFIGSQLTRVVEAADQLAALWSRLDGNVERAVQAATAGLPEPGREGFTREIRAAKSAQLAGEAAVQADSILREAFVEQRRAWAVHFAPAFTKIMFARAAGRADQAFRLAVTDPHGVTYTPTPLGSAVLPPTGAASAQDLAQLADLKTVLRAASRSELRELAHAAFLGGDAQRLGAAHVEVERRSEEVIGPDVDQVRALQYEVENYLAQLSIPEYDQALADLGFITQFADIGLKWRAAIHGFDAEAAEAARRWRDVADLARQGKRPSRGALMPDGRYVYGGSDQETAA